MPNALFVDTSRCTACRGCQVACKEWHDLPATRTRQRGSHQNPPDLNPFTYKLVRFSEHRLNDKVEWFFFPDQCRHCVYPPCKDVADSIMAGAVIQDEETGAVLYTDLCKLLTPEDCKEIAESCPYNIPRYNSGTGMLTKCDMCIDRQRAGLVPMCVKTCPTGTMNFGTREDMLALARETLGRVKKDHPDAEILDSEDVSVIYLVTQKPELYYKFAVADASAAMPFLPGKNGTTRKEFLANLANPVRRVIG
jgi:formate dehydrogenase iron-sulfur subunit